jgi:hypothetical protein
MASQRPQGGGILPPKTLKSLDDLVDRLNHNASNSYPISNNETNSHIPILALLVGTNEGIPLSRSYGTTHNALQAAISDEVLSSIETIWATLPSATPPHVKNAMNINLHMLRNDNEADSGNRNMDIQKHQEPPHPLLSQLGLGDTVRTTMAFYDHVTVIHVHIAPLVVTILASPNANLGSVKSIAVPVLTELLKPVKHALVRIRYEVVNGGHGASVGVGGTNGALGISGGGVTGGHNMNLSGMKQDITPGYYHG